MIENLTVVEARNQYEYQPAIKEKLRFEFFQSFKSCVKFWIMYCNKYRVGRK